MARTVVGQDDLVKEVMSPVYDKNGNIELCKTNM